MQSFTRFKEQFPRIKLVTLENTILLGAPLGTNSIATDISSKHSYLKIMCERLSTLPAHVAFFLRKTFFLYKIHVRLSGLLRLSL